MIEFFKVYMSNCIDVGKEEILMEESKKLLFVNQILIFIAHATITQQV